jgi:signal transduction histidine kinase
MRSAADKRAVAQRNVDTDRTRDLLSALGAEGASALRSADRLAGLGTLVAGVAHELNNPITYVIGNLQELARWVALARESLESYRSELERALGPAAGPVLRRVQEKLAEAGGLDAMEQIVAESSEGAARIRDTVRELLSYARAEPLESVPVGIHDVLDFNLRMLKGELVGCAVLVRDYRATRSIRGNRASLGQVLLNLLRNAIQACAPARPPRHQLTVRTRDCTGGIEIDVIDTGSGIPAELRPNLFTPFFTTKVSAEGTGLGLYISRCIVEEHGGSIEFACPSSGGTRFRIYLPAPSSPKPAPATGR